MKKTVMDLRIPSILIRILSLLVSIGLIAFGVWWMAVAPQTGELTPPSPVPLSNEAGREEIGQKLMGTNSAYLRVHLKAVEVANGQAVDGEVWVEQQPEPRYFFQLIPRDGVGRQWGVSDGKEILYVDESAKQWLQEPVMIQKGLGTGDAHAPGKFRNGTQMPEARFLDEIVHPEQLAQGEVFLGGRLENLGSEAVAGRSAVKFQMLPPEGEQKEVHRFWIDRETGMILRYLFIADQQVVYEFAVTELELDGPREPERYKLPAPPEGFARIR